MVAATREYEVIITESAERAFFEILDYLFRNYSHERAESIVEALLDEPLRLKYFPEQGSLEPALQDQNREYRFILFERHNRATIKIIYFVDIERSKVYITDYFPTEMHPRKISDKNR